MYKMPESIRLGIKQGLGFTYKHSPFFKNAKKYGLTIFVFHDVSDNPSEFSEQYNINVSIETFKRQIEWISSNFEIIHPAALLKDTPIPNNGAIISFDDGCLGSFENGLRILEEMKIPSIFFLNMQPILEKKVLLSAATSYLSTYVPEFNEFCKSAGLLPPFHLTLTPSIWQSFLNKYGYIDQNAIKDYQGAFADLDMVKRWDNENYVVYGNHLYEHWNAPALTADEFERQYKKNEVALSTLKNSINYFAFTNGCPAHMKLLRRLRAGKVFSSSGGVNDRNDKFFLDRISLCENDRDDTLLWYRNLRGSIRKDQINDFDIISST